jgi:hypothetical protein
MTTAQDYATRYKQAFETNTLTQGEFHTERDGRQLACALGVIGPDINDAKDCPTQSTGIHWGAPGSMAVRHEPNTGTDRGGADEGATGGVAY